MACRLFFTLSTGNKDHLKRKKLSNVFIWPFCNSKSNMQINFITRSKSANLDSSIQIFITKLYYLNQKNAYFQRVQIRGVQIRVRIEGGVHVRSELGTDRTNPWIAGHIVRSITEAFREIVIFNHLIITTDNIYVSERQKKN